MYQRILAAVDFSRNSREALRRAACLSGLAHCPVTLTHVISDLRNAFEGGKCECHLEYPDGDPWKFNQSLCERAARRLRAWASVFGSQDIEIQTKTLRGNPAVEIIREVQSTGVDLVVVGTHGRLSIERWALGSVTDRLVRHCPCAVWAVDLVPAWPLRSILAPVDFSPASAAALRDASWLAAKCNATLHVAHVIDTADFELDRLQRRIGIPARPELCRRLRRDARSELEEFLRENGVDPQAVSLRLDWGAPWKRIGRMAGRLDADLIVMGTFGRTGVPGVMLGSTAHKVLHHFPRSVLTVKPPEFGRPLPLDHASTASRAATAPVNELVR